MEIKVNISKEEEEKIYEKARDDIREKLTNEAIEKFIAESKDLNILELIRTFGLYDKYISIKNKKLKDLTKNEKLIAELYWLIYDSLIK